MARRIYSPAISEELIKPLYHYSKHLGVPMTKTVNRLITRGLILEPLPTEAFNSLHSDALKQMHLTGLEKLISKDGIAQPIKQIKTMSEKAPIFSSPCEISDWYEDSLTGVARSLATLNTYKQLFTNQPQNTVGQWFYENTALNLGQTFYQATSILTAHNLAQNTEQYRERYEG